MSTLEFIDTHFHLWDQQEPGLRYDHWNSDYVHPQIGEQFQKVGEIRYLIEDYIDETNKCNVTKAVHVEATTGTLDPVKETEWLQKAVDKTGFPHGIVAHASLMDSNVEDVLAKHCEYPNVRGIRDVPDGDYLLDSAFHRGYALLERFGLVASLDVKCQDMGKERMLADKFPNIKIVIDHAGFPTERTKEYFYRWRSGLRILSGADNIVCKISGLGMCDWNWTVDSIRPWVLECIEIFGPDRCLFATNWPVDRLFSTYEDVVDAYTKIIESFTYDEKQSMFSRNAEELYNL